MYMTMRLDFTLDRQVITRIDSNRVVAGSKGYVIAHFTDVSGDWVEPVTAIFGAYAVMLEGMECAVPWEVLADPGAFEVSAFCGDLHTANTACVDVEATGYKKGETPGDPTPDVYAVLVEKARRAEEIAQSVRDDANAGHFDGEDGKTPVRGVDYWTPEDRKPIEDATLAATTAAGRADAAAATATEGEASRVAAEAERANAETARAKAEQAREGAETGRVEAEKVRAIADAERGRRVDAAVQKADAATAEATEAAGKATASATEADAAAKRADEAAKGASENVLKGAGYGTIVNVNDAWPSPVLKAKVLGQSNQVTTTGKNLIKLDEAIKTSQGLELDIKSSGQLSINGTCTGSGLWLKIGTVDVVEGKTYYLSLNKPFPSFGISAWSNTDNKHVIFASSKQQVAKGVAAKTETLSIFAVGGNDTTFNNELVYVQIEEGQKTNWEPCTGGKPSPSPEYPQEITNLNKAELVITGKNLINPNRLAQIDSSYYQAVDGQLKLINSHNAAWKDVPIYGTLQAGTYTLSGDNIEIRDVALNQIVSIMPTQIRQFTLKNPTAIKMKVGYGLPKYPVISKAQLEVGSKATAYEPHQSKSTPIDLKGNELCSLPNGVKDEVVIDAEGNVSLIKRTKQYDWNCAQIIKGTGRNYAVDKVLDIGANYTGLVAEKAINATNNSIGICYVNQKMIYVTVPESVATKEQANQLYGGMKVIYQLAEPQTIPLGKVELPALPEATSNVWNDGNIPASVYINYLKDVNIAFADLESKLTQAVVAAAANL